MTAAAHPRTGRVNGTYPMWLWIQNDARNTMTGVSQSHAAHGGPTTGDECAVGQHRDKGVPGIAHELRTEEVDQGRHRQCIQQEQRGAAESTADEQDRGNRSSVDEQRTEVHADGGAARDAVADDEHVVQTRVRDGSSPHTNTGPEVQDASRCPEVEVPSPHCRLRTRNWDRSAPPAQTQAHRAVPRPRQELRSATASRHDETTTRRVGSSLIRCRCL